MGNTTEKVVSADGTAIAFERSGEGPPVILVGAALQDRTTYRPLAAELAAHCTAFNYDRRGRGESGDGAAYRVEREIEDLAALVAEAGGSASVYGHSSGAALALRAAAYGLPVPRLVLHEPPYTPEEDEERRRASQQDAAVIGALLSEGRRAGAIARILGGIGLPQEDVERTSRDAGMLAMAHTLAYDFEILDSAGTGGTMPAETARAVTAPALILCGGESPGWMVKVGARLAGAMPEGRQVVLEGQGHFAPPEVLAPVLAEFFTGGGRDAGA